MAAFSGGSYTRSRIYIDSTMGEKDTQATTVHEVFHCFQATLGWMSSTAHSWLKEATAVWSEDHIYKGYNTEWAYLKTTFAHLDKDRIRFDGNWEYSNYLFFFFAEQYLARNDFIVKILKDALTKPVAEALRGTDLHFDTQIDPKGGDALAVTTMFSRTLHGLLVKLSLTREGIVLTAEISAR